MRDAGDLGLGQLGDLCRKLKSHPSDDYQRVEVMRPIEASLTRVAGRFRWQVLLKGLTANVLHQFTNRLMSENPKVFARHPVQVTIDVDPYFMM